MGIREEREKRYAIDLVPCGEHGRLERVGPFERGFGGGSSDW
jgi:hypothetical protein